MHPAILRFKASFLIVVFLFLSSSLVFGQSEKALKRHIYSSFEFSAPVYLIYSGPSPGAILGIGLKLNSYISTGLGLGFNTGLFDGANRLPVFLDAKGSLMHKKRISPFLKFRAGLEGMSKTSYFSANMGLDYKVGKEKNKALFIQIGGINSNADFGPDFGLGFLYNFSKK
jgi:hypothetical protein